MKRARISGVMLVIILVHAHFSISDPAKTNDTTSVCDGSLQECSEFPTITTSHFARMLAQINTKTLDTLNPRPSCPVLNGRYINCFPHNKAYGVPKCRDIFQRTC
ncbi:hypothetical protein VNO80_08075 [Phaseolus coccineus]|uniref:Uncharacterized protein n=1 Tax=Phaseolus coccineus TaxID=3886 RepID=A0AAN9NPV8_PHACN